MDDGIERELHLALDELPKRASGNRTLKKKIGKKVGGETRRDETKRRTT